MGHRPELIALNFKIRHAVFYRMPDFCKIEADGLVCGDQLKYLMPASKIG